MNRPRRPTWRDYLVYALARFAFGFAVLAPERLAYGTAGLLGRLFFRCSRRRQALALRQLGNAFGSTKTRKELLAIGRISTGYVFQAAVDVFRLTPVIAKGKLRERIVNPDELRLVPKAPALVLTGHLGAWEVSAMAVASLGTPGHAIGRRFKNPLIDEFVFGARAKGGLHIHPRRGGIRPVARALAEGCYGLLVVDQNQRLRGVFAPWFGELASCERAAATLALRRGYPILVGACYRVGTAMRYRLRGSEPIHPVSTGDPEADVLRIVTQINQRLEEHILHCPEQYLWIHDRYRTQPGGTPDPADASEAGNDDAEPGS